MLGPRSSAGWPGLGRPGPAGLLLLLPALLGLAGGGLALVGAVGGPLVVFGVEAGGWEVLDGGLVLEMVDLSRGGGQVVLDDGELVGERW